MNLLYNLLDSCEMIQALRHPDCGFLHRCEDTRSVGKENKRRKEELASNFSVVVKKTREQMRSRRLQGLQMKAGASCSLRMKTQRCHKYNWNKNHKIVLPVIYTPSLPPPPPQMAADCNSSTYLWCGELEDGVSNKINVLPSLRHSTKKPNKS